MSVIDIVQLGFSLKNNSDAITNKLLNDLKEIQKAGKIKIEIDDSKVRETLATLEKLSKGTLNGVGLGQLPVDFLKGFENIGQSVEESKKYIDDFISKLQQLSNMSQTELSKLTNKDVNWNKLFDINSNDIENKRKSIEDYVVSEKDAIEKLKELQKQEQELKIKKQSNPSRTIDNAIQKNYEEQVKYIERIKALKADVQNFDLESFGKNNGINIISDVAIKRIQSGNESLRETVQLIKKIGKVDTAANISNDVLKNGIIRTRIGSQLGKYSTPIVGGGNNRNQDTSGLKSSIDGLKSSIDNLNSSIGNLKKDNNTNSNNNKPQNPDPYNINPNSPSPTPNRLPKSNKTYVDDATVRRAYLIDLERELSLERQILEVVDKKEQTALKADLRKTNASRKRNQKEFFKRVNYGLYSQEDLDNTEGFINAQLGYHTNASFTSRITGYGNRAQDLIDNKSFNKTTEYKQNLQEVLNIVNKLHGMGDYDLFSDNEIHQAEQLEEKIKTIFDTVSSPKNQKQFELADEKQLNSMQAQFEKFMTNNSKGEKPFATEVAGIRDTFTRYIADPSNVSKAAVDQLATSISNLKTRMEQTGNTGKSFSDIFRSRLTNLATYVGSFMSFYRIIGWVKELSSTVVELNTKMVELSKVSNTSIGDLERQFSEFESISKEVGGTISDTIQATADWSRNGLSLPDAKELARVAQIYKNIGDGIDINQANESLISTMRGFNIEAKDSMKILDAINEVANTQPIDSGGIGEALKRSAASFQAANTDLNEAIALITAANCIGGLHRNM